MVWDYIGTIPGLPTGGGGPAFSDAAFFKAVLSGSDTNATPTDSFSGLIRATFSDTNATQSEAVKFGFALPGDTVPAQTDSRSAITNNWITTSTGGGTNPANAYGPNNGTVATIQGAGGLSPGTTTVNFSIPPSGVPAGGTKQLRVWAQGALGVGDSLSITWTNTSGVPSSGTVMTTAQNFLTTPYTVPITTLGTAFTIVCRHTGALVNGAGITIDAAAIDTSGI